MKISEFGVLLSDLCNYYKETIDKRRVSIYYDHLQHYDMDLVISAIKNHVARSPFFPKISDIINQILYEAGMSKDLVLDELHRIISLRQGQSFSTKSLLPITSEMLRELGGKSNIANLDEKRLIKEIDLRFKRLADKCLIREGKLLDKPKQRNLIDESND